MDSFFIKFKLLHIYSWNKKYEAQYINDNQLYDFLGTIPERDEDYIC